jgi:hypothetical protein
MKRLAVIALASLSLSAIAAVAADAPKPAASAPAPQSSSAPLPALSAAQVVERNVAARGGLDAWHAVKSMTLKGRMEAGGEANPDLPFVMKMKRPHKSRLEVEFNQKTAIQVYDGATGWKLRPFLNRDEVEPYTAAEAKSAKGWEELDGPLMDVERKGTKVALVGTEQVEGKDTYKLKLTLKDGQERNVWIDGSNFLERKMDGEPRRIDGRMRPVLIYFRGFKKQDGLTVASVLETQVEGVNAKPHKMSVDAVAFNEAMDDTLFGKPQARAAAAPVKPAAAPAKPAAAPAKPADTKK